MRVGLITAGTVFIMAGFQNCSGIGRAINGGLSSGSSRLGTASVGSARTIVFSQDAEPFDAATVHKNITGNVSSIYDIGQILVNKNERSGANMFTAFWGLPAGRAGWAQDPWPGSFAEYIDVTGGGSDPNFQFVNQYRFPNGNDESVAQNGNALGAPLLASRRWYPPTLVSAYSRRTPAGEIDKTMTFFLNDEDARLPGNPHGPREIQSGVTFQNSADGSGMFTPFATPGQTIEMSVEVNFKTMDRFPDRIHAVGETMTGPGGNQVDISSVYPTSHMNAVVMFVDTKTSKTFYFVVLLYDHHRIPEAQEFVLMDKYSDLPMVMTRMVPGLNNQFITQMPGTSPSLSTLNGDQLGQYLKFGVSISQDQFLAAVRAINQSTGRDFSVDPRDYKIVQAGAGLENGTPADTLWTCGAGDPSRRCYMKSGFSIRKFQLDFGLPTPSASEFTWSYNGAIPGQTCTQFYEASDPHTWGDNFLCSRSVDYNLTWNSAGPIPGKHCVAIEESSDPDTWSDNYLCSDKDLGFRWSMAGPIAGMNCLKVNEPAEPAEHAWDDNFLCLPK